MNVDDPLPQYLIVVLRLLAHVGKPVDVERARALLCPPSINGRKVFDRSVSSLAELGVINRDNDVLSPTGPLEVDHDSIVDVLRQAILATENNTRVGEDPSQSGPRDLVRALCWFLTIDPTSAPLGWAEVQTLQPHAIKDELGAPIVNDTRWNPFCSWSSALGFCTPALTGDGGSQRARLTPDCTAAVRRTVLSRWEPGQSLGPSTVLGELRGALPVLPGGSFSTAVGIEPPDTNHAGPSLSFALLRLHDERWIRLEQDDDARSLLYLHDPDQPGFPRTFSSITVLEAPRG
ncbi:protein DpdG [Saccharothrix variisporea]|uniref:protein DpdG n=1 Tax=Saccharothrix variisporea TaxID=543527 RepID=UPI0011C4549C|nr:protein DpdG [Saccharothrix variisporea]